MYITQRPVRVTPRIENDPFLNKHVGNTTHDDNLPGIITQEQGRVPSTRYQVPGHFPVSVRVAVTSAVAIFLDFT